MITVVQGNVLDSAEQYVVQQCDCISPKPTKLDADYLEEFPWATVYEDRQPMNGFRNLAHPDSQGKPGEIKVYDSGYDQDPKVIAIFSQICPGKSFTGMNSKRRYKDDSVENRLQLFTKCLEKITELKPESIAFPDKIGCLNNNGGDWEAYSDILQEFADKNPDCYILVYHDATMKQ